MIYYIVAISVCVFFIGYLVGYDRGVRKTHERIVMSQFTQKKTRKTGVRQDTATKKLRLVKHDDTRE